MSRFRLFALIALASTTVAFAANAPTAPAAKTPPVPTCVVSGEHLEAGHIVDYVYQEPGKPDRHVRLCCRKCVTRFKADPAKYLKKLDELEAQMGRR
jgi:hypothetical protein